jgi:putative redox protein
VKSSVQSAIDNKKSTINNLQSTIGWDRFMIAAKVVWTDNERYIGEANSRHAVVMDTAAEKTASTPMELVLIALCGCTASDVVGILRKKREPFTALEVRAEGERASGYPAVYTAIKLVYRVSGKVSHKAMEDAVRLSKEKYCSVSAMLEKTAKISLHIEYDDAEPPQE